MAIGILQKVVKVKFPEVYGREKKQNICYYRNLSNTYFAVDSHCYQRHLLLGDFYATQAQTAQGKEQSLLNDKAYECFKFVENGNGIIWVAVIFFLLFLGVLLIFDRISFKSYACLILVFIASSFLYLKCLDIAVVGMAKTNSCARVIMLLRNARFWILIASTLILYAILKLYKAKKA
jgi:hypothetical protein